MLLGRHDKNYFDGKRFPSHQCSVFVDKYDEVDLIFDTDDTSVEIGKKYQMVHLYYDFHNNEFKKYCIDDTMLYIEDITNERDIIKGGKVQSVYGNFQFFKRNEDLLLAYDEKNNLIYDCQRVISENVISYDEVKKYGNFIPQIDFKISFK